MSFISQPRSKQSPLLLQILAAFSGGLVLFFISIAAIASGYQLLFSDRIFPGISMAGVDLSNLTPEQAAQALDQRLAYPTQGRIVLRYGERVWVATPEELGMLFDTRTSVQRAYELGREGGLLSKMASQLNAWQGGLQLAPVIEIDARVAYAYLQNIAAQLDQPVVEADLRLDGTQVLYTPGQTGRLLDVDKLLASLLAQVESFRDGEISLVVEEEKPVIMDASSQAGILSQILSAPLTLRIENNQVGDPGPWSIDPVSLASMLSVGRVQTDAGWQYQITVNSQALQQFLEQIAPAVNQTSKNARFYFDDPTSQLVLVQPAVSGRTLDLDGTRTKVIEYILRGEHDIPIIVNLAKPQVGDDATAASLGISGLVSSYTSYFRGSGTARMQNIDAASKQFYGLLIPPFTTFSMGEAIGDISLDNGYAEALIIYNGKTITGVGGGVCQVSTTLFRTAYYGGYPIDERHEHAYRVYYYEQTAYGTDPDLAGMDATVYFPLVDLKFTNDRPYWLLMETYFYPHEQKLLWKFYSGDDGRTVDVQNLGLQNVIAAPEPRFEENPDLPPDTCKQVDWPGDGADITVIRTVTRNGQPLSLPGDTIYTHYEPWQAVYQFGPGTANPQALAAQGMCH